MSNPRPEAEALTYAGLTDSMIDRLGGRYAAIAPTPATRLPAPQWCIDGELMPMEPPLGWDINAVPDLGLPHEPAPTPKLRRI
jgi:hypothetical protein